ncbi:hypothetical protein AC249_AIPGENE18685, partial [Exaiptasia diaphana]
IKEPLQTSSSFASFTLSTEDRAASTKAKRLSPHDTAVI